jgi:hypothetical protein
MLNGYSIRKSAEIVKINEELERLYEGRIGENSILCTDSHKSYM